jgi:phenylacetic acid degradation operon negative regulatory protein
MDRIASPATRALVAGFRRRRPLRAGSLLITIFGDAIAPRGGTVSLSSLIGIAAPFGISERLVRTSVGRLAQEGWLAGRRERRHSEYGLSETGRSRFAEATLRIYGRGPERWSRDWTLVLLPQAAAVQREALREPLGWLGFGQLEPGLLAHPTCQAEAVRGSLQDVPLGNRAVILQASTGDPQADQQIADSGWDLAGLAERYRRFVRQFEPIRRTPPLDPASAFAARTLLIHEYRRIHLRDPLLPDELLPAAWVGTAAYDLCRELYPRLFAQAEAYLDTTARRLSGPLPPPDAGALQRFGGLSPSPATRGSRPAWP